jgi:hypothetical protein
VYEKTLTYEGLSVACFMELQICQHENQTTWKHFGPRRAVMLDSDAPHAELVSLGTVELKGILFALCRHRDHI